jgi:hypothetical protein
VPFLPLLLLFGVWGLPQQGTEGTFPLPCKIPTLCLVGASPKPQKAKAKAKMALAALVSSQKQKHMVVKIFMK